MPEPYYKFVFLISLNQIKVIYDFLGDNAVVTIEECDTGIACDGLAMSSCPVTEPTIVKPTQVPGTDVTIDPNAVNVNPVSENPDITEVITSSGNILKAFGFIIAFVVMLV